MARQAHNEHGFFHIGTHVNLAPARLVFGSIVRPNVDLLYHILAVVWLPHLQWALLDLRFQRLPF